MLQVDGAVVAFVAAVPSGERVARVLMLGVLPERRHMGFGRQLMGELYSNSIAKGYDTVILEVRKSNKEAIRFYEHQGFSLIGEINNFYSNGEDAYKMSKTLQS